MGTHQNAVQRAVVLTVAVIGAGFNGALDALIGMTVHCNSSFTFGTPVVYPVELKRYWKFIPALPLDYFYVMI